MTIAFRNMEPDVSAVEWLTLILDRVEDGDAPVDRQDACDSAVHSSAHTSVPLRDPTVSIANTTSNELDNVTLQFSVSDPNGKQITSIRTSGSYRRGSRNAVTRSRAR